jgi:hypothetical protein
MKKLPISKETFLGLWDLALEGIINLKWDRQTLTLGPLIPADRDGFPSFDEVRTSLKPTAEDRLAQIEKRLAVIERQTAPQNEPRLP